MGERSGNGIGRLNEKPLHAGLKAWYARPGDRIEAPVDGYVVDIVRGDLLIEIQTRNVSQIRRKLSALAERHPVRLVVPVAAEKWIVRLAEDGVTVIGRRRSPKRGRVGQIFDELVSVAKLLPRPSFSVEVLMVREEEVRYPDPTVNWRRRGWAVRERRLIEVVESHVFATMDDLTALLPPGLAESFTAPMLAKAMGQPLRLAGRMIYCLRQVDAVTVAGRRGRSVLYTRRL